MSKVFNMMTGGGKSGAESIIIWANGVERSDVKNETAIVANGPAGSNTITYLVPAQVTCASTTSSSGVVQYAYLRVGLIDLTHINTIQGALTVNTNGGVGDMYFTLFVSKSTDARSWNGAVKLKREACTDNTSDPDRVAPRGTSALRGPSLDVSDLSGDYYIYLGTDSNNAGWQNGRSASVYSIIVAN